MTEYEQYCLFYRDIRRRRGRTPDNWLLLCEMGLDEIYRKAEYSYNNRHPQTQTPFLIRMAKIAYKYVA